MNIALWIIGGLLAVAFLASGVMKLTQPKERLASRFGWAEDFSAGAVRAIGTLEVLAAVGLVLPAALDMAPVLVPLAAVGLVVLMAGAIITHLRRHEAQVIASPMALLALAVLGVGPLRLLVLDRLTQRGAWVHPGRDAGPGRGRRRRTRPCRDGYLDLGRPHPGSPQQATARTRRLATRPLTRL